MKRPLLVCAAIIIISVIIIRVIIIIVISSSSIILYYYDIFTTPLPQFCALIAHRWRCVGIWTVYTSSAVPAEAPVTRLAKAPEGGNDTIQYNTIQYNTWNGIAY